MAANPNSFDYFRRGQPMRTLKSSVSNVGFDYYRRGKPLRAIIPDDVVATTQPFIPRMMGIPTAGRRDRPGGWN